MTKEQAVLDAVRQKVERWNSGRQGRPELELPQDGVAWIPDSPTGEDWCFVVVRPKDPQARAFDYYDVLNFLEGELAEEDHLNVLLVPILPAEA